MSLLSFQSNFEFSGPGSTSSSTSDCCLDVQGTTNEVRSVTVVALAFACQETALKSETQTRIQADFQQHSSCLSRFRIDTLLAVRHLAKFNFSAAFLTDLLSLQVQLLRRQFKDATCLGSLTGT